MANQQRSDRERHESNGIAQDINVQKAIRTVERYPVMQGWLLLGLGTVLILFSLGFFPIIKWAIFAGGLALAVWGGAKIHMADKLMRMYENIRNRF